MHAGPHPVQNPVDHLPVIPPPAATTVTDRQERPKSFPFGIRQVAPPHDHVNDSATEQSHDQLEGDNLADIAAGDRVVIGRNG